MGEWELRFRTYCYGCRRGQRWHGRCIWRSHRFDWEYLILIRGVRVVQRGAFLSFERAEASARRSFAKWSRALAR